MLSGNLMNNTIAPCLQEKQVHKVPFLLHVYLLAADSLTLFYLYFSFWSWEYLKLGMWFRDNTAQNMEACKTSYIWSSSKSFVRDLYLGKKQKEHIHWRSSWSQTGRFSKSVGICLLCKIMCDTDSWDGVAEVILKAWSVSLNRAVQHCWMCIIILWSKVTCA